MDKIIIKLNKDVRAKVIDICNKFNNDPGELINVLHQTQDFLGYLPAEVQELIAECLEAISDMEKHNVLNPDLPANRFGQLMASLFDYKDSLSGKALQETGYHLDRGSASVQPVLGKAPAVRSKEDLSRSRKAISCSRSEKEQSVSGSGQALSVKIKSAC